MDLTLWHRLPVKVEPKPGRTFPLSTLSGQWVRNTVGRWTPTGVLLP